MQSQIGPRKEKGIKNNKSIQMASIVRHGSVAKAETHN